MVLTMHRIACNFPPTRRAAYAISMSHDQRSLVLPSTPSYYHTHGRPDIVALASRAAEYLAASPELLNNPNPLAAYLAASPELLNNSNPLAAYLASSPELFNNYTPLKGERPAPQAV